MSLNFNYKECAGPHGSEHDEDQINPVLNILIWYTIPIGLNEITEKNVDEWLFRMRMYDHCFGTMLQEMGPLDTVVDRPVTWAELKSYIGLHTNASCYTRTKWFNQVIKTRLIGDIEVAMHKERAND